MKIFPQEINDNLSERIRSNNSVALLCAVSPCEPSEKTKSEIKIIADKIKNSEQFDLYYLNSILVSTGWNKNDDVFGINEVWTARKTPEDKQFNYMHDETDIIGHITGNIVVDSKGDIISDDSPVAELPDNFDIVTSSVLYNSWSTPELKERMGKLIAEIEEGKWFVSMECLFTAFDYAVESPQGEQHVVARDEASAFLTKHLRAYGGNGDYEGFKVGRLLKNIAFSGKGLVNQPANLRSVILKDSNPFTRTEAKSINQLDITRETNIMSNDENLLQQVQELKAQLEESRQELQTKTDEAVAEQLEAFKATVAEKDTAITDLQEIVTASEGKIAELEALIAEKDENLTEATQQIASYEQEAKTLQRKNALAEAGVDNEEAGSILEAFSEASDEMFDALVALIAAKKKGGLPPWLKKDEDDKDDKDDKKKKKKEDASEVEADEDEAEASAEEEVLEQAEEDAEAALVDAGETDSVKSARTVASEWLVSNVLRTTANIDS